MHFEARCIFTVFFITVLVIYNLKDWGGKTDYLPKGICLQDVTFDWTDKINTFTLQ